MGEHEDYIGLHIHMPWEHQASLNKLMVRRVASRCKEFRTAVLPLGLAPQMAVEPEHMLSAENLVHRCPQFPARVKLS